jgi:hypothetical protein
MSHFYLDELIPSHIVDIMKRIILFPRQFVYVRDISNGRRAPERVLRAMEFLECWEFGRIQQDGQRQVFRLKKVSWYELQQRVYLRRRLRELGFSPRKIITEFRHYTDNE